MDQGCLQVDDAIMVFGGCDGQGMLKSAYLFSESR